MFGEEFMDIPIVQVSIDGSLSPERNWAVGSVVKQLRQALDYLRLVPEADRDVRHEGVLILSGGLLIHNLRDITSFSEDRASDLVKDFASAILDAVTLPDVS